MLYKHLTIKRNGKVKYELTCYQSITVEKRLTSFEIT